MTRVTIKSNHHTLNQTESWVASGLLKTLKGAWVSKGSAVSQQRLLYRRSVRRHPTVKVHSKITRQPLVKRLSLGKQLHSSYSRGMGGKQPSLTQSAAMSATSVATMQRWSLFVASSLFIALGVLGVVTTIFLWQYLLPAAVVAELVFAIWIRRAYWRLNKQPDVHRPPNADPRVVFDRFVKPDQQQKLARYIRIEDMMSKWFWDVPYHTINRGNIADLLTYGFWYKSRQQLEAEGQGDLPEQLVQELEAAWGIKFPDGYNQRLPFMAHLLEHVRCHFRPLIFYLVIEVLFFVKHVVMLSLGFKAHKLKGFTYYLQGIDDVSSSSSSSRCGAAADQEAAQKRVPMLFMHGVGLGLGPYITFLIRLVSTGHPVVAVECNHLGMRLVAQIPDVDEVVSVVLSVLDHHAIDTACVVGHSYGTFMASRLVQREPHRVQSLCLVDPVCFCMFTGKLIHSFVYDHPFKTAQVLTWFIARDIHHAVSVCRNFYWTLLNLWPDQLPAKTLVVLAGRDDLVPVQEIVTMLERDSAADILYKAQHRHADFLRDLPWQNQIVEKVARMAELGPSDGGHGRSDSASSYETLQRALESGGKGSKRTSTSGRCMA